MLILHDLHRVVISLYKLVLCVIFVHLWVERNPLDQVCQICKDCGLYEPEIDVLIDTMRHSMLTPGEQVQLWKDTAETGAVELCRDCVDAVVGVSK